MHSQHSLICSVITHPGSSCTPGDVLLDHICLNCRLLHMITRTACMGSSPVASCADVVVVLACAGDPSFQGLPLDGFGGSPGLTVAFVNISTLPLSVSSGMRHTTLDLMQPFVVNNRCSFDLSTRPTQTALTQALSNLPALILSASAIFAMTTSPNGTNADSYWQPLVLSYGVCFVL